MADETTNQGIPEPEGDADLIQTDYEIGQDNIEGVVGPFGFDIHNPVFMISGGLVVLFVAYALAFPGQAEEFFVWLRPALTSTFDWFFLLAANIFVVFCLLLIVFFVTSSDSGSLVIDTITAGGKIDAPVPQRVFWCTFEGLVAIALLIGGGLTSLQAMVISTGLPFTIVLLLMCWAILKGLMSEPR